MRPPSIVSDINLLVIITLSIEDLLCVVRARFRSCNMSWRDAALELAAGRSGPVAEALTQFAKTGIRTPQFTQLAIDLRNKVSKEHRVSRSTQKCGSHICNSTRVKLFEACDFSGRLCLQHCTCVACNTGLIAFAVRNEPWSFEVPPGTKIGDVTDAKYNLDERLRRLRQDQRHGAGASASEGDRELTVREERHADRGAGPPLRTRRDSYDPYACFFLQPALDGGLDLPVRRIHHTHHVHKAEHSPALEFFVYSVPHVHSIERAYLDTPGEKGARRTRDINTNIRRMMLLAPPAVHDIRSCADLEKAMAAKRSLFLHKARRYILFDVKLNSTSGARVIYCTCQENFLDVEALLNMYVRSDVTLSDLQERLVDEYGFRASTTSPGTVCCQCVHTWAVRSAVVHATVGSPRRRSGCSVCYESHELR